MSTKIKQPELCAKCGARLYDDPLRPARLCPRHLQEAREAAGPFACSSSAIDEGMGEALPPESKGTLTARGLEREWTCCVCGAEIAPGSWAVKIPGRGYAQTQCAGDEGWGIA
jgi:hypothetical protein